MRGDVGLAETLWAASKGDADQFMASGGGKAIALGSLLAILSAIANGSFTIFAKARSVRNARVDPFVFNFWASIGIVLSSLLVLFRLEFAWTPYGLLSGFCFVLSGANSYRAVRLVGVSVGTGVWSGTAVVVSFFAGLLFDPEGGLRSLLWAAIAIAVILIGIGGVTYSGHVGRVSTGQEEQFESLLQSQSSSMEEFGSFSAGVFSAVIAGVLGGLIMLPLTRAGPSVQGLYYLPSFAIGVAVFAPCVTAFPYLSNSRGWPNFAPAAAALPGIVSGIVWNIGNTLSILAIGYISYSIAYPIMQCGIFVAGLWGMMMFQEIDGSSATFYWISGAVIIIGIALLSFAK